jgi:predicted GNAT family N-acyltransferase
VTAPLHVRLARPDDLPAVYALRHEVFVIGQDVPEDMERDALDDVCDHAVAVRGDEVVGTGRLLPPEVPGGPALVGRMAVRVEARGVGVGAAVLAALEQRARDLGRPGVELHAQVHARPFYERAGYTAEGAVYLDAGIDHVTMRKPL